MPFLRVNGEDLRALGFRPQSISNFEGMPARKVISQDLPGVFGSHLLRVDGGGGRRLNLSFALIGSSVVNRVSKSHELKAIFSGGLNRIVRDIDGTPQVTYGVLDGEPTWTVVKATRDRVALVSVPLFCPVPLWFSVNGMAIGYTGTPATLPLGTGPSFGIFRPQGDGSARTVNVYDAWGRPRLTFALPSLTTSDFSEIDNGRGVIDKIASGTRSSIVATTTITAGTPKVFPLFPFALDQTWGDYRNNLFPFFDYTGSHADCLLVKSWL